MARERFLGLGRTSMFMVVIIALTKGLGFLREVLRQVLFSSHSVGKAVYLVDVLVV